MNAQALHNTTILVRFANPAKPGKKEASIKTSADEYYGVAPKDLAAFHAGRRYKISYTEREYQGRIFRTIKSWEPEEVNASAMPASSADRSPSAGNTSEIYFVTRLLAASITAGNRTNRQNLVDDGKMFAQVYRDIFGVRE